MQRVKRLLGGAALLATPQYVDNRGVFTVQFESETASEIGLPHTFVQDNESLSHHAGTVRGIHLQLPPYEQGKLVRVLAGRVLDVIVDLRVRSVTFGQHDQVELDAGSGYQLWVPPGFGHAFCTMEPDTRVLYKVDAPYDPESERTVAWDDATLSIEWPLGPKEAVLSAKDAEGLSLGEIASVLEEAAS